MTEREWCERFWPALTERARVGRTITYKDLKQLLQCRVWQRTLSSCLGRIANYCHMKGWPILTVLVVGKISGRPGNGLPFVDDFKSELEHVRAFPWQDQPSPVAEEFPESACLAHA